MAAPPAAPAPIGSALTRRFVLRAGGATALGALVAACGGTGTSTSTTGASAKPVKGGELVVAMVMDIATLDPAFSQNISERYALYAIYDTFVAYDHDFNLQPALAESWETSEDGKSITMTLRQGVTFHDGTPFNAEAAKWNLDRFLDKEVNSPNSGSVTPPLESVTVVDDSTIRLNLAQAWRPLLAALGERPGFVVSPTAAKKYGEDFGANPVGTGPFELVDYTPGQEIKLERNTSYWNAENIYLDGITIKHVAEQQQQLTMLRTGEAHIGDKVTPQLATTVANDPAVVVLTSEGGSWWALQMDCDKAPFDDPKMRQAIAHATDREGVIGAIYQGKARVGTGPLAVGWAAPEDMEPIHNFDLDKATQLVTEAGADGTTVNFTNASDSDYQSIVQLLSDNYGKIGFTLASDTVPGSDYYTRVIEDKIPWSLTQWVPRADPDGLLRLLFHTDGGQNSTAYSNPEVDRLLDEAAPMTDTAAAADIYYQVVQIIEEDAPYVFVCYPDELIPHNASVGGVASYPDAIYRLKDYWISQ